MTRAQFRIYRFLAFACALIVFGLDADDAFAQSRNCQALANTLQQIERSGDYRNLGDTNDRARQLEAAVQQAESRYVRDGCNAAAKRGEKLSAQCRAEARDVLKARDAFAKISQQNDSANAIAQQREAILQEMARFNCDSRSSATVNQSQSRGNLFDQLFGAFEGGFGDGVNTRGDQFSGYAGYETVRTVCVRKVDGYYWPVSYSTLVDYAPNDLAQCEEQCPGMDVDLYYYDNPGQEPEQMINLQGEPYTALPTAFAYRTSFDRANSCKTQVAYGSISLDAMADGTSRAIVSYADVKFPLPLRDPRREMSVTVVPVASAQFVSVPLPRPRPPAPGEAPKPVVVKQATTDALRIVQFGDKRVRVVGPDTPYAPTAATGT